MIGNLNKRITIEEQILTPDGSGGFSGAWQSIAANPNVYAAIVPLAMSEQLRYHQLQADISHRIVIRYRQDISAAMRIVCGAKIYEINSVIDKGGRKEYLEILATVKE